MERAKIVLACVLLAVLGGLGVWRSWPAPRPQPAPTPVPLRAAWATENEWLAGEIVRDTAEIVCGARVGVRAIVLVKLVSAGPFALDASSRCDTAVSSMRIAPQQHIWAPADYVAWVAELLARRGAPVAPTTRDPKILSELLDPRTELLVALDHRLSQRLERQLLDAGAHEDAALLLAAFALREAAGPFTDVRFTLCRITSHLAVAAALRGSEPAGVSGRVAEAVLLVLAGRGRDASASIAVLAGTANPSPELRAWIAGLRLRLVQDWRQPPGSSAFERREHLLARVKMANTAVQGVDEVSDEDWRAHPDWSRIVLSRNVSVELAWRFAVTGVERELSELSSACGRDVSLLPQSELIALANIPAERLLGGQGLGVLGGGQWSAAFQRHLAAVLELIDVHWRGLQSKTEEADRALAAFDKRFRALTLYPLVALTRGKGSPPTGPEAQAATTLVTERPELATATLWVYMQNAGRGRAPARTAWFSTGFPFGTAFWPDDRLPAMPHLYKRAPVLAACELDPFSRYLAFERLHYLPVAQRSLAGARAEVGDRLDYDLEFFEMLLPWASKEEAGPAHAQLCELDANRCSVAAQYALSQKDEPAAARAYQRFFDHSRDRVGVANEMRWLVEYYERHDQPKSAEAIARAAAATYASGGLEALARLLEQRGRWQEAERLLEGLRQRYDDPQPLIGFYQRAALLAERKEYVSKLDHVIREFFPNGLEKVGLADLHTAPRDGLTFTSSSAALQAAELSIGDAVVALDGIRIHSRAQYTCARALSEAPELVLLVWRKDRGYFEVRTSPKQRKFGVDTADYAPPSRW